MKFSVCFLKIISIAAFMFFALNNTCSAINIANDSLSVDIRNDNGAIDTVIFGGSDFFNRGTPVSDYGFQNGTDVSSFLLNRTTGDTGLSVINSSTQFMGTVNDIVFDRGYSLVYGINALKISTTFTNTGGSGVLLSYFDTFDPDQGFDHGLSHATFNDVFAIPEGTIGQSSDSNGLTVIAGSNDPRVSVAAGAPFRISNGNDLNDFFDSPFDGNGSEVDGGLHIGLRMFLDPGESTSFAYSLAFGLSEVEAQTAFIASLTPTIPSYPTEWTRQFGTAQNDLGRGVAVDNQGNLYVTGTTHAALPGETHAGLQDAFLSKYDNQGNLLWTEQFGTSNEDDGYSVAIDVNGNAFIAGPTQGDLGGTNQGSADIHLTKVDSSGNYLWSKQIGTTSSDESYNVTLDPAGNPILTGRTSGALQGSNTGGTDAVIIKYDNDGNHLWSQQFGTSANEFGRGVATDADGNIFVTGFTGGDLNEPNSGAGDAFLVKFDANGSFVWSELIGGGQADYGYDVAVDDEGTVYLAGYTQSDLVGVNAGQNDLFIAKYTNDGTEIWTKMHGGVGDDYIFEIAIDQYGNLAVGGTTDDFIDGLTPLGGQDGLVSLFDNDGNHLWSKLISTVGTEEVLSLAFDSENNLYLGGYTGETLGASNLSGFDAFVMKLTGPGALVPEPSSALLLLVASVGVIAGRVR